ncbi:MAG: enoyl-CoA hydratase/isomerase family protein [Burkholderiales bacterium]
MSFDQILFEQKEPGIFLLTVNRPKQLNALSPAVFDELEGAFSEIAQNPQARVLLITGAGEKAFVAGADIARFQGLTPIQALAVSNRGLAIFRMIEELPVPAIALVNGYALGGGCEFALACDFILASDNAVFGQPEIDLGIMPGWGGTQRLTRLVGRNRALELLMTGRQVKADEALRIGLTNAVYPREQLLDKGMEIARSLAAKPAVALKLIKQAVQRGQSLDLDNASLIEAEAFALCFTTGDQKEGVAAFLEKRPARFTGG